MASIDDEIQEDNSEGSTGKGIYIPVSLIAVWLWKGPISWLRDRIKIWRDRD